MTPPPDPDFTDEQREAWSSVAPAWYRHWAVLEDAAQSVNERLVELAGVAPGHRVLDVACGIGEPALTAARIAGAGGEVHAFDLSPEMVRYAERRAAERELANARFAAADAEELDVAERSFDAAVCRWGLMLMGDPARALDRIRSALAPGARLAAAVWGPAERVPFLALGGRTVQEVLGGDPPDPQAPGPMRLGGPGALRALFEEAGFTALTEETLTVAPTFDSPQHYVDYVSDMSSSLRKRLDPFEKEDRERFFAALRDAARRYAGDDGRPVLESEVICVVGTA